MSATVDRKAAMKSRALGINKVAKAGAKGRRLPSGAAPAPAPDPVEEVVPEPIEAPVAAPPATEPTPSEPAATAAPEAAPATAPAPKSPARKSRASGTDRRSTAKEATTRSASAVKDAAPRRPVPGEGIGPTEITKDQEWVKFVFELPLSLIAALNKLLISEVRQGVHNQRQQHFDAAFAHFLPAPEEEMPDFGKDWKAVGCKLRAETRMACDIARLELAALGQGRRRPVREIYAESLRRYIANIDPGLVKDVI